MKKIILIFTLVLLIPFVANASELSDAISSVRSACRGISDEMADMKIMAGINAAITGVGSVAGGVALGTGIAKAKVDKEIEDFEAYISKLNARAAVQSDEPSVINVSQKDIDALFDGVSADDAKSHLDELNQKSKTLGNVRTGTMAGAAVTNIAGTVIAGNNRVRGDLQTRIAECIATTKALSNIKMQARISGAAEESELTQADKIISACGAWESVDLSKIDNRAKRAMISSAVGATTGVAGTITSASANSDAVRSGDNQKEKKLNTASNVLAGTTAVASGAATVFNASQISAIKRATTVADECEGAL